jgi:hypothetical protein
VNTATKITELPALTADLLQSNSCLVDNLFADLWKQMGMKASAVVKCCNDSRANIPIESFFSQTHRTNT